MTQKIDSTEAQMQILERKAANAIARSKKIRPSEKKTEAQLREAIFGVIAS